MPASGIATPHHSLQHPSLPTNATHYCQPLTPTATTHHNKPPLMPPSPASTHHGGWWQWGTSAVGGNYGWQQMMNPVGGSGGWLSEKNFFCSKWAKKPKKLHVFFLFYPYFGGGWVGQTQIWIYPYSFLFFLLNPSLIVYCGN